MSETITFTQTSIIADCDTQQLPDDQRLQLEARLSKLVNREIEKALFAGWPPGYDPGKGMPGTLNLNPKPRCQCSVICMCGRMVVT